MFSVLAETLTGWADALREVTGPITLLQAAVQITMEVFFLLIPVAVVVVVVEWLT